MRRSKAEKCSRPSFELHILFRAYRIGIHGYRREVSLAIALCDYINCVRPKLRVGLSLYEPYGQSRPALVRTVSEGDSSTRYVHLFVQDTLAAFSRGFPASTFRPRDFHTVLRSAHRLRDRILP